MKFKWVLIDLFLTLRLRICYRKYGAVEFASASVYVLFELNKIGETVKLGHTPKSRHFSVPTFIDFVKKIDCKFTLWTIPVRYKRVGVKDKPCTSQRFFSPS